MANVVTVGGMFGNGNTYFADAPVVIDISGLAWPAGSPFNVVRVEVVYNSSVVGKFCFDTGGQSSISFDISDALKSIWADYAYEAEISAAQTAITTNASAGHSMREYFLRIWTEYLSADDGGVFTTTQCTDSQGRTDIPGGRCLPGGLTEWERSLITRDADRDVSHLEHSGPRYGDASTKPSGSPERVGRSSLTSWVDISAAGAESHFYTNSDGTPDAYAAHAPLVLRDSQRYVDFLFLNRRGVIETCSGLTKESMGISVTSQQYGRAEGPSFRPVRTLMAIGSDGRRSWQMSSGYVTREWAEWWTMEFLGGKRKLWWMLWQGPGMTSPRYVPVTVKAAKNDTAIYDQTKQQMTHVDFTVTLALEG